MKKLIKVFTLSLMIIPLVFMSCRKDDEQAEKSIVGIWDVVQIKSIYGTFTGTGFSPTETVEEEGDFGVFSFGVDSVDYSFTRNDTLFSASSTWELTSERVNEGFNKVTIYEVTIDNQFIFEVEFEDGTNNSEENAEEVTFISTPNEGIGVLIEMRLEKDN